MMIPKTTIIGARGSVDADELLVWVKRKASEEKAFEVQLIDADAVYGRDHIVSAVEHAARAFERGTNSAASLGVEVVLYTAAERQIRKAFERVGVRKGTERIAVVLMGDVDEAGAEALVSELGLARDDSVLEGSEKVLDIFGIGPKEREAVPRESWADLILERVAMLDLEK